MQFLGKRAASFDKPRRLDRDQSRRAETVRVEGFVNGVHAASIQ
jgi:hypothetical protein